MSLEQPDCFKAPTSEQLTQLAATALGTARGMDKIMSPKFAHGKARFFCHKAKLGGYSSEFDRHVLGFKIARHSVALRDVDDFMHQDKVVPAWQFRIKDTYLSDTTGNRGIRHDYQFAWDKQTVYRATQETTILPYTMSEVSFQALARWLANNRLDLGLLDEELRVQAMSQAEVADLSVDMTDYFTALKIR